MVLPRAAEAVALPDSNGLDFAAAGDQVWDRYLASRQLSADGEVMPRPKMAWSH